MTEELKLGSRDRELHDKGDDGNTAVMEMHIAIILWEWLEFWSADFIVHSFITCILIASHTLYVYVSYSFFIFSFFAEHTLHL